MRLPVRRVQLALTFALVAAGAALALWPEGGGGGGGDPRRGPRTAPGQAGDIAVVAKGGQVTVTEHLVDGKYTLIDFYADWCPNCRRMNPVLEALAGRSPDRLAIRKVNVISWDSPVARQYSLTALPHLLLYGPQGDLVAEGEAAWKAVHQLGS